MRHNGPEACVCSTSTPKEPFNEPGGIVSDWCMTTYTPFNLGPVSCG